MDNLVGPLFTNLATINICMTNIVTKTEILALVYLLFIIMDVDAVISSMMCDWP